MDDLRTLLWLRQRLLVNSLRFGPHPWLAGLSGVLLVLGALSFGGLTLWTALILQPFPERSQLLRSGGLWALTWLQILLGASSQLSGTGTSFDPKRFLLFPVAPSKLFLLSWLTVYGDITCWPLLPTLLALLVGSPLLIPLGLLWLGVGGLAVNLGLAQLLQGRREVWLTVLVGLLVLLPQGLRLPQGWAALDPLKPLLSYLPPQVLAQGDFGKALLIVGLWSVLLLVLSYRWFQQLTRPTVTAPTLGTAGKNWTFPGPVGAIFSKQLRYLVRNSLSYVQLGAIAVVLGLWGRAVQPLWGTGGPWVAVLGVNLVLFLNSQRFNSIFAYDKQGFKTYLCAPVAGETVLWAYNLSHLLWVTGQILVGLCIIQGLWGQVDLQVLLAVLVTLGVLGVGYSSVGNICSIYFPVSLAFGVGGRRGGSTVLLIALLANIGTSLLILPLLLFSFLTRYNGLWGNCGLLLCLGLAGLGYRALLPVQGRVMYQNREKLLTRLL